MNRIENTRKLFPFLLLLTLTVCPGSASAVQNHGVPEGLYVHQLAHIFFTAAMCYLFWGVRRSVFELRGWRFLQIFCVFMVLWNVVAFTGHFLAPSINSADFTREAGYLSTELQGPLTSKKLWYYFTQLDHLFSIPSLYFLYLAMKNLYHSSCEDEKI